MLLVVAADEGVRPQTVEHVQIAGLLGIGRAVVAVTRADRAEAVTAKAVGAEASSLLARNGIALGDVVCVSAVTGDGLETLRAALAAEAARTRAVTDDGFAFLAVDRAFAVAGAGTVVTGTLRRGWLSEGDELDAIAPGGAPQRVRVRTLQVRGARVVQAGSSRTAVNLRGAEVSAVRRGTVLASPGIVAPGRWLSVHLRATAGPIANGAVLQVLTGTDEVEARVRLLDADVIEAGMSGYAQLHAARALASAARERFVLRVPSPALTVGGGVVLGTEDRRERRRYPSVLARLAARDGASPGEIVTDTLARAGANGTTLAALGRAAGISPARAASLLNGSGAVVTRRAEAIGRDGLEQLARRLPALVAAGLRLEGSPGLVEAAIALLVERGVLARDGNRLAVRDAVRDATAARDEAARMASLAARLKREGLTPPDLPTLAPDAASRRIVERLVRGGVAIRATDRVQKRDWLFHTEAVSAARVQLEQALARSAEGLLVGEAGSILGLTRRHSVPLLEHFDAIRFTRRQGDRRVLARE